MTAEGATISQLRSQGFFVADIEKAFIFRNASQPEELNRILNLRLQAAQADGRWLGETSLNKMLDPWDRYARQLYCETNGKTVGAGRIVFNNGLQERSEHVSYGANIPDWLWQEGFVESSRLCTDPDFRGADIFLLMLQHISRVITQSGYRYLLLNCVDSLVPVYKKAVGVKDLNQRFHTEFMQDRALNLLYIDIRALQVGLNMQHSSWIISEKVGSQLIDQGQIKLNFFEKIAHKFYRQFHKAIVRVYERSKFKRESSRMKKLAKSESKMSSK
jgi:hypothetical protein